MHRLLITPLAEQDLLGILGYISSQRPKVARKWYQILREKCEFLSQNPELGEVRADLADDIRSFSVNRWVIYNRIKEETVEIHRVLDGALDARSQIS